MTYYFIEIIIFWDKNKPPSFAGRPFTSFQCGIVLSDPSKFINELDQNDCESSQITVINSDEIPENENEAKKDLENTENPTETEDSAEVDSEIDDEIVDDNDAENNDDNLSVSSMSTTREKQPATEVEIERPVETQPPAKENAQPREISPPLVEPPGTVFSDCQ